SDSEITIPGVAPKSGNYPWSFQNAVTPGYFDALRIPIKAGRDFSWADWGGAQERCLVNEALVKEYLDGASPVGRLMGRGRKATPNIEIVGVFGDARYHNVRGQIPRQTFVLMGGAGIRNIGGGTEYAGAGADPRPGNGRPRGAVRRAQA